MQVTPYLHFDGNCAEALEFYRKALNAKIETVMRFKDAPPSNDPQSKVQPEMLNQVMHSSFRVGDTNIMASDCGKPMQGFSLTVGLESDAEVDRLFNALSAGGQVFQAPQETFFASRFTVFNDPYGVNWILLHGKGQPTQRTEPERKIFC
jgi:PhnB protein